MKYNYISLKNGVLFRTQHSYTWMSNGRGGLAMVVKDGQEHIPVDGEVLLYGDSWIGVKSFKCDGDDIQATWKD